MIRPVGILFTTLISLVFGQVDHYAQGPAVPSPYRPYPNINQQQPSAYAVESGCCTPQRPPLPLNSGSASYSLSGSPVDEPHGAYLTKPPVVGQTGCRTQPSGNPELEELMNEAYDELKTSHPDWSNCNVHQIASKIQKNAEQRFQTTFETVAGIKDFVSKQHFYQNNICKIEREGRYILAFATPKQDLETPIPGVESSGYNH